MLGMKYVRISILKEEMEERVEGEADLTNLATARIELKHHLSLVAASLHFGVAAL